MSKMCEYMKVAFLAMITMTYMGLTFNNSLGIGCFSVLTCILIDAMDENEKKKEKEDN